MWAAPARLLYGKLQKPGLRSLLEGTPLMAEKLIIMESAATLLEAESVMLSEYGDPLGGRNVC